MILGGVAITAAGNLLLRFLDFAVAVMLLRWLTIYEYGVYRLALAAHDFFSAFFLSGLENVVVSDAAASVERDRRHARAIFTFYGVFLGCLGFLLWALFFFGSALLQWTGAGQEALFIISFLFLLSPIETALKLRFQIFLDFGWAAFFKVLADLTKIAAFTFFMYFSSFHTREALWSVIVTTAVPIVVTLLAYRRPALFGRVSYEDLRMAAAALFLHHGKWAIVSDAVNNAAQSIRPFIVKTFVGTEAVALIAVAQNLLAAVKSLFPVREALTPVLPRDAGDPAQLAQRINRATKYATWAYGVLAVVSAVGVPLVVFLFFPKYMPALPVFYILLLGLPFAGFRSVAVPVFYALKAQRVLLLITTSRTAILTVLNAMLTYFFGIWGAATEMVLIGIFTAPAYARAIRVLLPNWRFRMRDLWTIDAYDRAFVKDLGSRIAKRMGLRI